MADVEGFEWVTTEQEATLVQWYGDEWAENLTELMDNQVGDDWQTMPDTEKESWLDQIIARSQQQDDGMAATGAGAYQQQAQPWPAENEGTEQEGEQLPPWPPDDQDQQPLAQDATFDDQVPPPPPAWEPEDEPPPPPPEDQQPQQPGQQQYQPLTLDQIAMKTRIMCGGTPVTGGPGTAQEFVAALDGPDWTADITAVAEQVRKVGPATATDNISKWGSSELFLQADRDAQGGVTVTLVGALVPEDFDDMNDTALHILKKEGDTAPYAQSGPVVMVGPGAGEPRYYVIKYASQIAGGGTEGTITRRDHRMRRDSLDVRAVAGSDQAAFKAAMKRISDKSVSFL